MVIDILRLITYNDIAKESFLRGTNRIVFQNERPVWALMYILYLKTYVKKEYRKWNQLNKREPQHPYNKTK